MHGGEGGASCVLSGMICAEFPEGGGVGPVRMEICDSPPNRLTLRDRYQPQLNWYTVATEGTAADSGSTVPDLMLRHDTPLKITF